MLLHQIINTLFTSNTWVITRDDSCWVVDCGDVEPIVSLIGDKALAGVLLTHAHFDHIYGLNELLSRYPDTPVYTNKAGCAMLLDDKKNLSRYHETPYVFEHPECVRLVDEGDEIVLDSRLTAQVIASPGHNDSCLTFVCDDFIITGDAYIPGNKVVTNLPGGNKQVAKQSVERILQLAVGKTIYPGHGVPSHQQNQ